MSLEVKEAAIQAQIKDLLTLLGFTVWEMQKGSTRGGSVWCTKGVPDLYVFGKGKAMWLEVKRPKTGRMSPAQIERHAELSTAGIAVHVVRSPEEALLIIKT